MPLETKGTNTSDKDDEISDKEDALYREWSTVMKPGDVLHELLQTKEHMRSLFHGLRRQVKSLSFRSQLYDDGQLTIYDRVLLRLYEDGHTMQAYGLFEFYLAQHLGIKDCDSREEINSVLAAHFAAQSILDKGPISEIPVTSTPTVERQTQDIETRKAPQSADKEKSPYLDKLLQVYQNAKADYYSLEVTEVTEATESHRERTNIVVRFLRDTAENLLRYLNEVDKGNALIPEVEDIIKVSQEHANKLAGGRKRKFEHRERISRGNPTVGSYLPQYRYGVRDRYVPGPERWDRGYLSPGHETPRHGADSHANNFAMEPKRPGNNESSHGRAGTDRPL
ncbi:uncharacterized protein N7515_009624 [Penicillium bovifimosum]|uniref:Uncharacterized protein n=1 Tax=Penicillium bovifimosum TaxID=126998 RepID=A0A9W9GJN4_9EURO|nr:uncharacterized protein N7515_009624 [Penicillium bovifimosum]KAJ5121663.1 hypothetical protein N7515_009624 [Penicillium bovifimosum]